MKNSKLLFLTFSLTAIILTSCSFRVLGFTIVSSKNIDLSKAADFVRGKTRAQGKDIVHMILIIPTGRVDIKEALDKAIESTPGCVALLDGVIYNKLWLIPALYGKQTAIVEGTPLIDPSMSLQSDNIPIYSKIELDTQGKIKKRSSLSSEEYISLKSKVVDESKSVKFNSSVDVK